MDWGFYLAAGGFALLMALRLARPRPDVRVEVTVVESGPPAAAASAAELPSVSSR